MTAIAQASSLAQVDPDEVQHPPRGRMTEVEFLEWLSGKTRAEWVDGEVEMMAPDSTDASDMSIWLLGLTREFIEHFDLGKVLGTNVVVRLPSQRRGRMPDLLFVCKDRAAIIKKTYVDGPPDLIMEVVAPESVDRDFHTKFAEYQRGGVREYWVIYREGGRAEAYALSEQGTYQAIVPDAGKLISTVLPGFYLRSEWLLAPTPPRMRDVLRELGVH